MRSQLRTTHPRLESLEERTLLSVCHVTRPSDLGVGTGSRGDLRYCITKTNAEPGEDTIDFTISGTINLSGALPSLSDELTILGSGADQHTIRRDTGGNYRIFTISAAATVTIANIGIANGSADFGGGIRNDGSLTLANAAVMFNSGFGLGGGAGGIYNSGTLVAANTSVSGNVTATSGGGIWNVGTLSMTDCLASARAASTTRGLRRF